MNGLMILLTMSSERIHAATGSVATAVTLAAYRNRQHLKLSINTYSVRPTKLDWRVKMSISSPIATTVYTHELDENENHGAAQYLKARLRDITEIQEALEVEKRAINVILPMLMNTLCPDCKGQKKFWEHITQDEGRWNTCQKCVGAGVANTK